VGNGTKNKSGASIFLHGVQVTEIAENTLVKSAPLVINHTVGEPRTRVLKNRFDGEGYLEVEELNSQKKNTALVSGNQLLSGG
jgi:poly(beta-D-mannuronate) lyase